MLTTPDNQEDLRRRLKAALALAGHDIKDLPLIINQPGYSLGTLYAMTSDTGREILPKDFLTLAAACGLPREWFTYDLSAMGQEHANHDKITEQIEAHRQQITELKASVLAVNAAALDNKREMQELRDMGLVRGRGKASR